MQTFVIFSKDIVGYCCYSTFDQYHSSSCDTLYQYMNWFMIFTIDRGSTAGAVERERILHTISIYFHHLIFISWVTN